MELTASELWSRVLASAQADVPEQSYRTWLAPTRAVALSDSELVVETPQQFHAEWIEDKFADLLMAITERVLGRRLRLTFRESGEPAPVLPSVSLSLLDERDDRPDASLALPPRPSLNERYTFDRFVVGNDNQLANAACQAVANKPATLYNPLFLYGGVGLGKTHLMHAIGNQILESMPHTRAVYVSSEQFTNDLITAIQGGTTPAFRRRYREMDLLLVDDVHFLEGKERTQEEFFHTFNALYDAQRQIVLTSDRPPKELPGLEARLISRFEWGLVADVRVPDYETRLAILRKKAHDDGLTLGPEVIDFIAHSCTASVRELEGAVIKLLAYSSLTHQEITMELARRALTVMLGPRSDDPRRRLTPDDIKNAVAKRWGIRPDALTSKRRTKDVTLPRQVAMYLIREILDTSLVRIGEHFGGRDHSTVIHSVRKIEEMLQNDTELRGEVEAVHAELARRGGETL
jgi:chromosomal replication initiator protein